MGSDIKFNWVLQVEPPLNISTGGIYVFTKPGNRVFPLNAPIDLIDLNRSAVARIRIQEYTNKPGSTTGAYMVLKVYIGDEKRTLTEYWVENA